jgi:hypothetical protein
MKYLILFLAFLSLQANRCSNNPTDSADLTRQPCRIHCNKACSKCNEQLSQTSARAVIFSKDSLCNRFNLLNPPFPTSATPFRTSPNCGTPANMTSVLVGYHVTTSLPLNDPNNKFKFTPVWIENQNNLTKQYNGSPIIIGPHRISIPNNNNNNNTILNTEPNNSRTFDHSILQFTDLIPQNTLDKVFISWYELKMILENCQYLAISGTRVSSGNIAAVEWGTYNEAELQQTININYFTYKFIGYVENDSLGKVLIVSSAIPKRDGQTTIMPNTPTIAIGNPCPPMWR